MRWDDLFVGALALGLGAVATASAIGIVEAPYQLRTVRLVQRRYGQAAARALLLFLAALMLLSGSAILSGFRPTSHGAESATADPAP